MLRAPQGWSLAAGPLIKNVHHIKIKDIQDIWKVQMTKLDQKRNTRNDKTQKVSSLIQNHLNIFMLAKERILQKN